jgi:hypothetical protein
MKKKWKKKKISGRDFETGVVVTKNGSLSLSVFLSVTFSSYVLVFFKGPLSSSTQEEAMSPAP